MKKMSESEATEAVAIILAQALMQRAPSRRAARAAAVKLLDQVLATTSRITATQQKALKRSIELFQANDVRMKTCYEALPGKAQTEFWRSLALFQVIELDRLPAKAHTQFWASAALSGSRELDQLRGKKSGPVKVVQLFPGSQ